MFTLALPQYGPSLEEAAEVSGGGLHDAVNRHFPADAPRHPGGHPLLSFVVMLASTACLRRWGPANINVLTTTSSSLTPESAAALQSGGRP